MEPCCSIWVFYKPKGFSNQRTTVVINKHTMGEDSPSSPAPTSVFIPTAPETLSRSGGVQNILLLVYERVGTKGATGRANGGKGDGYGVNGGKGEGYGAKCSGAMGVEVLAGMKGGAGDGCGGTNGCAIGLQGTLANGGPPR